MANYLTQQLAQYSVAAPNVSYVFPTLQNLEAGNYSSEIVDVREVLDENGDLAALDFYHKLVDSNGNVTYVRFRYYDKELPGLAQELMKYPQVETWKDAIGIKEKVVVSKKASGNYLRISERCASEEADNSSMPSSPKSSDTKRSGGLLSSRHRYPSQKPTTTQRIALMEEDDDSEFDDFLDDETED